MINTKIFAQRLTQRLNITYSTTLDVYWKVSHSTSAFLHKAVEKSSGDFLLNSVAVVNPFQGMFFLIFVDGKSRQNLVGKRQKLRHNISYLPWGKTWTYFLLHKTLNKKIKHYLKFKLDLVAFFTNFLFLRDGKGKESRKIFVAVSS